MVKALPSQKCHIANYSVVAALLGTIEKTCLLFLLDSIDQIFTLCQILLKCSNHP